MDIIPAHEVPFCTWESPQLAEQKEHNCEEEAARVHYCREWIAL
jgi:hypothetical protein